MGPTNDIILEMDKDQSDKYITSEPLKGPEETTQLIQWQVCAAWSELQSGFLFFIYYYIFYLVIFISIYLFLYIYT